jgi:hypothetical protein
MDGEIDPQWLRQRIAKINSDEKYINNIISALRRTGFLIELKKTPGLLAAAPEIRRKLDIAGLITDPKIRNELEHSLKEAKK